MDNAAQMKEQPDTEASKYAVVEIFGHRRHAGRVMEVEQFGAKMLRIDVPKTDQEGVASFDNGYESLFYGGASIFGLSLTDLDTVIRMNKIYPSAGLRSLPNYAEDDQEPDVDDTFGSDGTRTKPGNPHDHAPASGPYR